MLFALDWGATSRTVQPIIPKEDGEGVSYELFLNPVNPPGMEPVYVEVWKIGDKVQVFPGKWEVTVTAFISYDEEITRLPFAWGRQQIEIGTDGGTDKTITVEIRPRPLEGVGNQEGTFRWRFYRGDDPDGLDVVLKTGDPDANRVVITDMKGTGTPAISMSVMDLELSDKDDDFYELKLPPGQYSVSFMLTDYRNDTFRLNEVLHVYPNLVSTFSWKVERTNFPRQLLDVILDQATTNGNPWSLVEREIRPGHFSLLDIKIGDYDIGVLAGEFGVLTGRGDENGTVPKGESYESRLAEMTELVDAALICLGTAGESVKAGGKTEAERILREMALNGSDVAFAWPDNERANVTVGSFTFQVRVTLEYSITINEGGNGHWANPNPAEASVTVTLNPGIRVGHTFDKWTVNSPAGLAITETGFVMPESDVEVTATWIPNIYTVTFDSNGGTPATQTKQAEYGTPVSPANEPTRTGYIFKGWFDQPLTNEYDFATPVTGDFTLYAKWEPKPTKVEITSGHILTTQGLELAFTASVTPTGASQEVTWSVAGNDKASFAGDLLKVAADAKPGTITVTVTANGDPEIKAARTLTILRSTANAGGYNHTAAIRSDGTLWSWGFNSWGQLGNNESGNGTDSSVPVQEYSKSMWVSMASGERCTTAIRSDGTLWSWGYNGHGQLGNGTTDYSSIPVQVSGGGTWVSVGSSPGNNTLDHTAAIRSDGTLWAWGSNTSGQLGNTTIPTGISGQSLVPVQEDSKSTWISVAAGRSYTAAIRSDGTLWSWGYNYNGQLGNNSTTASLVPVQENSKSTWFSVAAGNSHTAAIRSDGTLWSWGYNYDGQLGNNSNRDSSIPVQENSKSTWVSVTARSTHTAAIRSDGTLWSWGSNDNGQLGNDSTTGSRIPVQVSGGGTWISVAAGNSHTTAIRSNGTLWSWGSNYNGQLGNNESGSGTGSSVPVQEYYKWTTWRMYPVN